MALESPATPSTGTLTPATPVSATPPLHRSTTPIPEIYPVSHVNHNRHLVRRSADPSESNESSPSTPMDRVASALGRLELGRVEGGHTCPHRLACLCVNACLCATENIGEAISLSRSRCTSESWRKPRGSMSYLVPPTRNGGDGMLPAGRRLGVVGDHRCGEFMEDGGIAMPHAWTWAR